MPIDHNRQCSEAIRIAIRWNKSVAKMSQPKASATFSFVCNCQLQCSRSPHNFLISFLCFNSFFSASRSFPFFDAMAQYGSTPDGFHKDPSVRESIVQLVWALGAFCGSKFSSRINQTSEKAKCFNLPSPSPRLECMQISLDHCAINNHSQ